MSMTKDYLHSLPQAEQDAILGRPDEWDDDAENEPTDEELAEWARALMEEDDEPTACDCDCHRADGGGLVCSDCAANHVDKFTERENAPLVKPQPKGVTGGCFDI